MEGGAWELCVEKFAPSLTLIFDLCDLSLQVNEFLCHVYGYKSLYGLRPETLDSLILDLLPPLGHTYCKLGENSVVDDTHEVPIYLLQEILSALRSNAGFHIPRVRTWRWQVHV